MKNIKLLFIFILLIILTNCFYKEETPIDPSHIKINDDIYLKPLGKNKNGCLIFSAYSINGNMVAQVIYFLDKNGNPTTNSNPKNCK